MLQPVEHSLILNQILESKDYTKTNCYVVISPKTENSTISQPYYFNDTEDLIFEIKIGKIRKHAYMYIRIYDVSNKKDIFNKYFSIGGEKKLLNAISPKDLKISS